MRLMFFIAILLSMSVLSMSAAHAQDDATPAVNPLANSSDFLAYHPDLGDRKLGMEAFKRGSFDYAARYFQWAARYADKPSQAMLGSMYWSGQGVQQDRALAYAWMDLAAERGYPSLLGRK
jgi:TPR repeat protein